MVDHIVDTSGRAAVVSISALGLGAPAAAEFERAKIIERTTRGRLHRLRMSIE